jgi:hypothetical protein
MAMFISYNPEDIIRQAEESTLRYQQGKFRLLMCSSSKFSKYRPRRPPPGAGDSAAITVQFKQR